ncbi:MAG: hypothetical protein Q9195_007759 [Heterodermia aff. obscurata]
MANSPHASIGDSKRNWVIPYARTQDATVRDAWLALALSACRNKYWMAIDLASLPLDANTAPRQDLIQWLVYYFRAFTDLSAKSRETTHRKQQTSISPGLQDLLDSDLRMLRAVLLFLDGTLSLDGQSNLTPDPEKKGYLLLPKAQPLELLIDCVLKSKSNLQNLGALKDEMLKLDTVHRQLELGIVNQGVKEGLPKVVFVCFDDLIVSCSLDDWSDPAQEHRKDLSNARTARFPVQEQKTLNYLRDLIAARFGFVEGVLTSQDLTYSIRAGLRILSRQEYNNFVQYMYQETTDIPNDTSKVEGRPIDHQIGNNHLHEAGRAFHGSGEMMFTEMSRCWKCRFLHHYKTPRPGEVKTTGLEAEEPTQTTWNPNKALVCAEDLCHVRCKAIRGDQYDPQQNFAIMPYPLVPA